MDIVAQSRCFGGIQYVYRHDSAVLDCSMRFALFLPPAAAGSQSAEVRVPALLWLSGLTCTEENFTVKAGAQRVAAELGLALIMPDTSPRGEQVPDDPDGAWDFGLGAGFYVDANRPPWSRHYRMSSYLLDELLPLIGGRLPVDAGRIGVSGHSMGGHGALTLALRNPDRFGSVSAFAPICSPIACPWGQKALGHYLGPDSRDWRGYDACALLEDGARLDEILVDQGDADGFLESQLKPALLEQACAAAGVPLTLRLQPGYDHSYYFIASFIEEHLRWHAARLLG